MFLEKKRLKLIDIIDIFSINITSYISHSVHSFNATKSFVSVGELITKISLVVDASFISASAVTAFATTLKYK